MPSIFESRSRSSSALFRSVSRSSPNSFRASSARTPESRWSSRCDIGCPTLTESGSTESRERMSATISGFGRCERLEIDFEFGRMDAFGVLVQFRAPGAPSDADHFRHLEQKAFGDRAHARRFGKRDARVERNVDRERAFVEGRKERALQAERARTGAQHRQRRDAEQQSPVSEGKPRARHGSQT